MVAQKGKDLLLKVDSDGLGAFTTVAGTESVDVTDSESAGQWRELLTGGGIKSARVAGSGIFKDAASDETVRGLFFNGTIRDWQVIVPDFGTVQGAMQITALEFAGNHDGEVTYDWRSNPPAL